MESGDILARREVLECLQGGEVVRLVLATSRYAAALGPLVRSLRCGATTALGGRWMCGVFTQLLALTLIDCSWLTDDLLRGIVRGGCLRCLELWSCYFLSDVGLRVIGDGLPGLQKLTFSGSTKVLYDGLGYLSARCPKLCHADLSSCDRMTEHALCTFARGCPRLEVLDIWGCWLVADDALQCLGVHCKGLRQLDISGLVRVTDEGLMFLADGCSRLEVLDAENVPELTTEGMITFVEKCSALKRLVCDCEFTEEQLTILQVAVCPGLVINSMLTGSS